MAKIELGENIARAASLCMGDMPPPLKTPSANFIFPELLVAVQKLELQICESANNPGREQSSTITINKFAQFKPHRDSGGGAGQRLSMIVGLGNYTGGKLVIGGEEHDIRYKPMEFDGFRDEHWTTPFDGERFSIVWCVHVLGVLIVG
jgi:hypothetical protein